MVKWITAPHGEDPKLGMLTVSDDSSGPGFDWILGHKGSGTPAGKSHRGKQICLGEVRNGFRLGSIILWTRIVLRIVAHLKMVPGVHTREAVKVGGDTSQAENRPSALSAQTAAA